MKTLRSAGIIVFRKENNQRLYLLLLYPGHYWGFSRGNIEEGENPRTAALRELKEETGLSAQMIDGFESSVSFQYLEDHQPFCKNITYFIGKTEEKAVSISDEHRDYRWATYPEAQRSIHYPETRQVLDATEAFLSR